MARGPLVFIPHHTTVAEYYDFMLEVHVSGCLSVVHWFILILFPDSNLSKYQRIFAKLGIYMYIDVVEI